MRVAAALGRFGEEVACRHLEREGLRVLARNWRCPAGEIDLVARDGATLVFCEVKTRRGGRYGAPAEAVTAVKAARLRRAAGRFLAEHRCRAAPVRFDVVAVVAPPRGAVVVEHLRAVL